MIADPFDIYHLYGIFLNLKNMQLENQTNRNIRLFFSRNCVGKLYGHRRRGTCQPDWSKITGQQDGRPEEPPGNYCRM